VTAAWALTAATAIMAGAGFIAAIRRGGRRDGKIDIILERLAELAADHENRIRELEHGRAHTDYGRARRH
jgi:hypothetical protein